jgi:hypothetical protein
MDDENIHVPMKAPVLESVIEKQDIHPEAFHGLPPVRYRSGPSIPARREADEPS